MESGPGGQREPGDLVLVDGRGSRHDASAIEPVPDGLARGRDGSNTEVLSERG